MLRDARIARATVEQGEADAIRIMSASLRHGADERSSHDESMASIGSGSIDSMVIIEPT